MAQYFEKSQSEMSAGNPEIDGTFHRLETNRFGAVVYRNGKALSHYIVFRISAV